MEYADSAPTGLDYADAKASEALKLAKANAEELRLIRAALEPLGILEPLKPRPKLMIPVMETVSSSVGRTTQIAYEPRVSAADQVDYDERKNAYDWARSRLNEVLNP